MMLDYSSFFESREGVDVKYLSISNIMMPDRLPLTPETLDLAMKIKNKQVDWKNLPPIKVTLDGGKYILRDGRHRYTALRLNGIKNIKVKVSKKNKL